MPIENLTNTCLQSIIACVIVFASFRQLLASIQQTELEWREDLSGWQNDLEEWRMSFSDYRQDPYCDG